MDNKSINVNDLGPTMVGLITSECYEKKLKYIKDIIDDYLLEGDSSKADILIKNILCVVTNKTCSTCKWHELEDITKGKVCVNADSDECTNWTDDNFNCSAYEVDPEWQKEFGNKEEK